MTAAPELVEPAALEVDGLVVEVATRSGWARVVDDVSFRVAEGETLAIVGESGSGKTITGLACMGLLPRGARAIAGHVMLGATDLLGLQARKLEDVRGNRIAMIFQEPMTSLNPALRVGQQIAEVVRRHRDVTRDGAAARAIEMLDMVGIPNAAARARSYPHEFSGGMRQRVMIAMALACEPTALIADEPTTALDVTIQAQVLDVLRSLQHRLQMALVIITHDLGVVADIADRVMVMYAGQAVELAAVDDTFYSPRHPYTQGLLRSMPQHGERGRRLDSIPGTPPAPGAAPAGCRFAPRCPYALERCSDAVPSLIGLDGDRAVRCIRQGELRLLGARQ